jgi:hypothetical protein
MVLHDIADDAEFVKIAATSFGAEGFFEGDLDIVNVVPVPGGAEELIAESKDEDVLHHLLAQVVVDSEDLVLGPVGRKGALEFAGAGKVFAEGLLDLVDWTC